MDEIVLTARQFDLLNFTARAALMLGKDTPVYELAYQIGCDLQELVTELHFLPDHYGRPISGVSAMAYIVEEFRIAPWGTLGQPIDARKILPRLLIDASEFTEFADAVSEFLRQPVNGTMLSACAALSLLYDRHIIEGERSLANLRLEDNKLTFLDDINVRKAVALVFDVVGLRVPLATPAHYLGASEEELLRALPSIKEHPGLPPGVAVWGTEYSAFRQFGQKDAWRFFGFAVEPSCENLHEDRHLVEKVLGRLPKPL